MNIYEGNSGDKSNPNVMNVLLIYKSRLMAEILNRFIEISDNLKLIYTQKDLKDFEWIMNSANIDYVLFELSINQCLTEYIRKYPKVNFIGISKDGDEIIGNKSKTNSKMILSRLEKLLNY